ncbi:hypothetical protein N9478_10310 [Gammaproteobacteria bacterium]|nr:hypothetical protein [Gammaproteobacteria bacterium]
MLDVIILFFLMAFGLWRIGEYFQERFPETGQAFEFLPLLAFVLIYLYVYAYGVD